MKLYYATEGFDNRSNIMIFKSETTNASNSSKGVCSIDDKSKAVIDSGNSKLPIEKVQDSNSWLKVVENCHQKGKHVIHVCGKYSFRRMTALFSNLHLRAHCNVTEDLIPQPKEFIMFLTYRCNFSCDMCTQYGGKFKKNGSNELSLDEWRNFIEDISIIKPEITLIGGEPLLYKGIDELLYILADNGCRTRLVTNGYFLKDHIKAIMETDTELIISIDGTFDIHDGIRHSGDSFERIIESLEYINILKEERPSFKFSTNSVLLPDNIEDIFNILDILIKFDTSRITLQHPQYSSPKINALTNDHWNKHFDTIYGTKLITKKHYSYNKSYLNKIRNLIKLVKSDNQYHNRVNFFPDLKEDELDLYYSEEGHLSLSPCCICTKPWFKPYIDPTGDVLICMEQPIGNIRMNNFWKIWNNAESYRFRSSLLINGRFPICTRCCEFFMDHRKIISKKLCIREKNLSLPREIICAAPYEM